MLDIEKFARPSVLVLKPYSSARDEFSGKAAVFLDANESPYNGPFNRYPDPHQKLLKVAIAGIYKISPTDIFLGNGSDEAIDLLIRIFCEPGSEEIVSIDPSYGMYEVAAKINDVHFRKVKLGKDFTLDASSVLSVVTKKTKMIFLCSPNNPSGNILEADEINKILKGFEGMVVVDEAYIDFSSTQGFLSRWAEYPNLVVLRTFSKAWGLAGLRMGMALGAPAVIRLMDKIKYPYNINILTQEYVLKALENPEKKDEWVKQILHERSVLTSELEKISCVLHIYPSDANFLLVKTTAPQEIYQWLVDHSVIIRDRSSVTLCEGCLRITVGSPQENKKLLESLKAYSHG